MAMPAPSPPVRESVPPQVLLHQRAHDRETQALGRGRVEVGGQAPAVVADDDHEAFGVAA